MSRSATAIEALVESAVLSWIGTLSSAITASHGPYEHPTGSQDTYHSTSRHSAQLFSGIILVILPHLLVGRVSFLINPVDTCQAISQVLIILRVNMTNLHFWENLCRKVSDISVSEHELEAVTYGKEADDAVEIIRHHEHDAQD
jgi:hypothetical protein